MMLRAFVGGLVLAAGAGLSIGAATAADLPVRVSPPTVPPVAYVQPVYNWSGFYVGGHIGGGQVGANIQFNALVLGVEGDFSWTGLGLKGTGADSIGNTIGTTTNWTSTVTGRVGAAFDRLLVYGKGGVAFAQDQSSLTDLGANTASTTFMRTGWTAGAGLEYGLSQNWSAKIEYDYLGFGSKALNFSTPLQPAYTTNANLNVQEVKAGLNFRFGP